MDDNLHPAALSYQAAALRRDRNGMNGRSGGSIEIVRRIVERIAWKATDDVLDVGCGDGLLLSTLPPVRSRTGIVPTDEELDALKSFYPKGDIEFRKGLSNRMDVAKGSADKIICNGVFTILPRDVVRSSLVEFRRICRTGGTVFVGEIPGDNRGENAPPPVRSRMAALVSAYRSDGVAGVYGKILNKIARRKTSEPLTSRTHGINPEEFKEMCRQAGFAVGEAYELEVEGYISGRFNYVLKA